MAIPVTLQDEKFLTLPEEKHTKLLGDDFVHNNNSIFQTNFRSLSKAGLNYHYA
jgi:hypothetical protein